VSATDVTTSSKKAAVPETITGHAIESMSDYIELAVVAGDP
jgi:hypothetical protein